MSTQYHPAPGRMFYKGQRFVCPCGNKDFRVEIGAEPPRFWCTCKAMYTEDLVNAMGQEREELEANGKESAQ
ncbi:MAG TPA: hypothetical protein VIY48_05305 [Candidatus Paceibacterota bacterium]